MPKYPRHGLFVQFGCFKADAYGLPAIILLVMLVALYHWL